MLASVLGKTPYFVVEISRRLRFPNAIPSQDVGKGRFPWHPAWAIFDKSPVERQELHSYKNQPRWDKIRQAAAEMISRSHQGAKRLCQETFEAL